MDEKNTQEKGPKEPEGEGGFRVTEEELVIALEKVLQGLDW
jgi:hypothetical protein